MTYPQEKAENEAQGAGSKVEDPDIGHAAGNSINYPVGNLRRQALECVTAGTRNEIFNEGPRSVRWQHSCDCIHRRVEEDTAGNSQKHNGAKNLRYSLV